VLARGEVGSAVELDQRVAVAIPLVDPRRSDRTRFVGLVDDVEVDELCSVE
jgi:hypothetical protein